MFGIKLIETISAEGDGYVSALRFVQKSVVNLTHHTMAQPQNIGIRPSRRGNWGIGTQRLGDGKLVNSVPIPEKRPALKNRRGGWGGSHQVKHRLEPLQLHGGAGYEPEGQLVFYFTCFAELVSQGAL